VLDRALLGHARSAGLPVELVVEGEPQRLQPVPQWSPEASARSVTNASAVALRSQTLEMDEQRERRSRPLLTDGRRSLGRLAGISRALPPRTIGESAAVGRNRRSRAAPFEARAAGLVPGESNSASHWADDDASVELHGTHKPGSRVGVAGRGIARSRHIWRVVRVWSSSSVLVVAVRMSITAASGRWVPTCGRGPRGRSPARRRPRGSPRSQRGLVPRVGAATSRGLGACVTPGRLSAPSFAGRRAGRLVSVLPAPFEGAQV
jgi:hypothetical protein